MTAQPNMGPIENLLFSGTPKGDIWFVSLAGSYLANIDLESGAATDDQRGRAF